MGTVFKHKRQINRKHRHLNWDYHCIRLVERLILSEKSINIYWYLCIADHLNIMLNGEPKMESNLHEHNNTSEVFFKNWKIKLGSLFFLQFFFLHQGKWIVTSHAPLAGLLCKKIQKVAKCRLKFFTIIWFFKNLFVIYFCLIWKAQREVYRDRERCCTSGFL